MEQKSGKRDIYTNGHKEEHYIQMLLLPFSCSLIISTSKVKIRNNICYIRSNPDGLMLESSSDPNLMRKILRLRNRIVKYEMLYAEGAVKNILENLDFGRAKYKCENKRTLEKIPASSYPTNIKYISKRIRSRKMLFCKTFYLYL